MNARPVQFLFSPPIKLWLNRPNLMIDLAVTQRHYNIFKTLP